MYPGRCDFGKHHSALQAPRFKDSASSNFTFQMDNDPWLAMSFFEIRNVKAPAAVKAKAKVQPKQKADPAESREKKAKRETKDEVEEPEKEKPKRRKSKKDWWDFGFTCI